MLQLQVNYMVNEKHSFGAFYKYDRHPSSDFNSLFLTDNYENGQYTEHSESRIWQDESFSKHIFNAYYNGKIGKLGIDLNIESAVFAEYGRQFGKVYAQVGLRYEHLTNNDFNFCKRENEMCHDYGDWFPTAVVSVPVGKSQLSLSYRRDCVAVTPSMPTRRKPSSTATES